MRSGLIQAGEVGFVNHWVVECFDKYGNLKWDDRFKNLVVNTGLDDILDKYWKGSGYTAAFYVGLIDASPTIAAADTMASHAGWAELSAIYDEAGRQALTLGTVASQAVDNSASKAQFAINTDSQSIGGAFISTDATKGGTSGILVAAAAFTGGNKSVDDGDTLNVQTNLTAASS